jgi:hypothetical protein
MKWELRGKPPDFRPNMRKIAILLRFLSQMSLTAGRYAEVP